MTAKTKTVFDILNESVRMCKETHKDGAPSILLDRIKRDGGRRCGFVDLPPLEACIHDDLKHQDIPLDFIVEGLTQPTFRNMCRRREGGDMDTNAINLANGSALSILQWSDREDLSLDNEQRVSFHTINCCSFRSDLL